MIRNRPISFPCFIKPLVVAFLLLSTSAFAQESDDLQTTDVTIITVLPPGLSFEKSIGEKSTLYGSAFAAIAFAYAYSNALGSDVYFDMYPGFRLQYRYYYNFYRRSENGKRTAMNSANYLAPVIQGILSKNPIMDGDLEENNLRAISTVGGVWGMQRNYRRWLHLNLELGVGYYFAKGTITDGGGNRVKVNYGEPTAIVNFALGVYLRKRKDQ